MYLHNLNNQATTRNHYAKFQTRNLKPETKSLTFAPAIKEK
ncbi:hypothetical protein KCTC32420_01378 [Aequorivita nionensis]